jgi:hypothetical protein
MKKRIGSHLWLMILVILLTVVAVGPVSADAPDKTVIPIDETKPLENNQCPFPIEDHLSGTMVIKEFVDKDGIGRGMHYSFPNYKETWSANGKTVNFELSGPAHFEAVADHTQFLVKTVGTSMFATLPHYGRVWGSAGNVTVLFDAVFNILEYKSVGTGTVQNWDAICDYLK